MRKLPIAIYAAGIAAAGLIPAPPAHASGAYVGAAALDNASVFHVYWVTQASTGSAAEASAMKDCSDKEGGGCFVLGSSQQCMAAVGAHAGLSYWVGYGATAGSALSDALAKAGQSSSNAQGHCGWD